ncbi:MAG: sigma-70 family RNA polymerase sigma factor [Sporichthyaceae bacterium]|nr:sigma-70 family RNA polymerase sigma factor [Sporichthyaceae bacterium]
MTRTTDPSSTGLRALRLALLAFLDLAPHPLAVAGAAGLGPGAADRYAMAVETEAGGWPTDGGWPTGSGSLRGSRATVPGARERKPSGRAGSGRTGRGRANQDNEAETQRIVALVDLARDGDPHAFGQLYEKYVEAVHRFIYYRVNDPALAEDLTSDTFYRALKRISSFTWQGRDFAAWLITIARNLVTDHFKSSRVRLERPTAEMLDADKVEDGPEDAVLDQLANHTLIEAVRQLSPQQQECVQLRFIQELSVAETAAIMGKNEGAIKTLQYRAMRTLARILPEGVR